MAKLRERIGDDARGCGGSLPCEPVITWERYLAGLIAGPERRTVTAAVVFLTKACDTPHDLRKTMARFRALLPSVAIGRLARR